MTKEKENDFTTVRLERELVNTLQERMDWGESYNDHLKSELDINTNEE